MGEARQIIDAMRLDWSEEKKANFALMVEQQKSRLNLVSSLPKNLSHHETIANLKSLVGHIRRAKKLVLKHDPRWEDDLPWLSTHEMTEAKITFTCPKYEHSTDGLIHRDNHWPLLLLNSLETAYARHLAEWEAAPRGRLSQRLEQEQAALLRLAGRSRRAGIKISATERSRFYRLAAYLLPHVSDLRARIKQAAARLDKKPQ